MHIHSDLPHAKWHNGKLCRLMLVLKVSIRPVSKPKQSSSSGIEFRLVCNMKSHRTEHHYTNDTNRLDSFVVTGHLSDSPIPVMQCLHTVQGPQEASRTGEGGGEDRARGDMEGVMGKCKPTGCVRLRQGRAGIQGPTEHTKKGGQNN